MDNNTISRRKFILTTALSAGGLVLGFHALASSRRSSVPVAVDFSPNAFIRIGQDDIVTVIVNHSEMGQGTFTALPMMVADELEADWSKVRFESAPLDPVYINPYFGAQGTGGSATTYIEWDRFRKAGATGKHVLLQAAAETWKVDSKTCKAQKGFIIHTPTDRKLSYGQLVEKAATIKVPENVVLKEVKDFTLIGKSQRKLDTPLKLNGSAIFGMDITVPGMLTSVIARPPVFGGKIKSYNADKTKAIKGVKDVVETTRGLAVVATDYYTAKRGRDMLDIVWDDGSLATLNSVDQRKQYEGLAGEQGAVAKNEGDVDSARKEAVKVIDVIYDLPYLSHATMEPLNCVADVKADSCELWVGTQFQTADAYTAAYITGLKLEQIKVNTPFLGGGFGRRGALDGHFVSEAVQVSQAMKAPVKVIWTREDDIRGGYYRPKALHKISAGVDATGKPLFWKHNVVCQSFSYGTFLEQYVVKNGVDGLAVEGTVEIPYHVPNHHVEWNRAPDGVPVLFWRSVGSSHTAIAVEGVIDELAFAANADPYEYRRALMEKHPRELRVLDAVAKRAGWKNKLPQGHAHGIAVHTSFGSTVAHVAEVSITAENRLKIHKFTCVIDCGIAVNPDAVKAQMEGCIAFGLTAALYGDITFEKGKVKQGNFNTYQILRINEMPEVDVEILDSTEKMGGVGEPGVPPVVPALLNAIYQLTGNRVRNLPLRASDLKKA